jgi:hypothetical protein
VSPSFLLLLALVQSASSSPPDQTPVPSEPAAVVDPARLVFPVDSAGLVLIAVKPDRTADYEAVISALQAALAGAGPDARRIADGWRVYKAADPDAKGNALYIHVVSTPVADADYRPSVVLAALLKDLPVDLLVKYRDAFAGSATRLALTLLADLAAPPRPEP